MTRLVQIPTIIYMAVFVAACNQICGQSPPQVSGLSKSFQAPRTATSDVLSTSAVKASTPQSQYPLGVPDVIHINVWKNSDLSQTVSIGPDGFISLALLGDLQVAGLTTNQLSRLLTERFSSFIVNPLVTVSVVEVHSRQVYVMGQVAKPGEYPIASTTSALQVIAQCGGVTTFANRKAIYILRQDNGHVSRIPFNYRNVIRGRGQEDIVLQPGDTVVVP